MGYSVKLSLLSKKEHKKIKNLSFNALQKTYTTEDYFAPYHVCPKQMMDFGDFINTDKLEKFMTPIFKESTQEHFEDDLFMILSKEGLEDIIKTFHAHALECKKKDLERIEKLSKGKLDRIEQDQLIQNAKSSMREWEMGSPYSLKGDHLVDSYSSEYMIFELVVLYKSFNFEENHLIIYAY